VNNWQKGIICVTGWPCLWHAVVPPENLSLTESFLGIASVLLWFGCLAIYDKSPGCLCHAKHVSVLGSSHGVSCCHFFAHVELVALGFSCNLPDEQCRVCVHEVLKTLKQHALKHFFQLC
jgi:hypothetical protein